MFASRAVICPADKQGRRVLPEEMRGRFGFAGEVVLVGGAVRFEIWVPSEWAAFQAAHEEGFKEVAQRVGL
jgi:MraZ protein